MYNAMFFVKFREVIIILHYIHICKDDWKNY